MKREAWDPQVGERVAIYWSRGALGYRAKTAIVARLTATQLLVDDGTRFNRRTLRSVGSEDELRPLDDPQVRLTLFRQRFDSYRYAIENALRRTEPSIAGMTAAITAVKVECDKFIEYLSAKELS